MKSGVLLLMAFLFIKLVFEAGADNGSTGRREKARQSESATKRGQVLGCDVSHCTPLSAGHISCSLDAVLGQHEQTRKYIAATHHRAHPAQTYLVDANPYPASYVTLDDPSLPRGLFEIEHIQELDYCYVVQRSANFDTDLFGMIKKTSCSAPAALPFRASVLRLSNAFVNQHGGEYINSLHAFTCHAHFVFGGCNDNVALTSDPGILAGVEDATVIDRAVIIGTRWGSSFYHWLLEELPRLAYVLPLLKADPNIRILTHDHRANRRIFEWLGLSPSRLVPIRDNAMFFVRDLLVPPVAHCGRPALTASAVFRRAVWASLEEKGLLSPGSRDKSSDELSKRKSGGGEGGSQIGPGHVLASNSSGHIVVITRGGTRQTTNHAELMAALRTAFPTRQFFEYGPDFVPLEETARIFSNARGVLGVHGAGMTNLIFTPSSSFLVEFHPHESNQIVHPNACHQGSADAFGQRHHMVWLAEGSFNGGVTIPPALAIAAICALDGGPASVCDSHKDLGEPAGPFFLTRQRPSA